MKKRKSARKKLTVSIDARTYDALHRIAGPRNIARFIEDVVAPYTSQAEMERLYREKGSDAVAEREALEWIEGVIGDVAETIDENEPR